jgi:hypothetical protein
MGRFWDALEDTRRNTEKDGLGDTQGRQSAQARTHVRDKPLILLHRYDTTIQEFIKNQKLPRNPL